MSRLVAAGLIGVLSLTACSGSGGPSASPSPTPPPRDCARSPHVCGFPDETSTGVTVPDSRLRTINHPVDLRTDGQVFQDAVVRGHVNIWADDVTVRNVRVVNSGEDFGIGLIHSSGATITDTEIAPDGPRLLVGIKDVYGDAHGTRVERVDIAGTTTGIQTHEGLIADSYIHDLAARPGDHVNGITSNGSTVALTIRHNTILNKYDQTDAISLFQDFGPEANRTITGNLLAGGGYTIYAGGQGPAPTHHIVITDNRISRAYYPNGGALGPVAKWEDGTGNQWSGNIWDDSLEEVTSP